VDAYPARSFEGAVVQVRNAPTTLQNVVTYDVVIEVDNSALELKPGMTAAVTITTDHRDDALRLPLRALRFRPVAEDGDAPGAVAARAPGGAAAAPAVFALDASGELRRVEVRTGLANERFAELLAGDLAPGDEVVVAYERVAPPPPTAGSPLIPQRRR
jgi:HlyD family secretion protein